MLIGFKIKNFKSFNELQHFSMVAGKTRSFKEHITENNNINILKFSAIYGANASGKSNLISAINLGKNLLLNGFQFLFSNQYFRIIDKNKNIPSYFEYEIEKDNKLYSYGFEININKKEIVSEWLIDMTSGKNTIIFERDVSKKNISTKLKIKEKSDLERYNACVNDIKNNNSIFFLKEMNRRIEMSENETLLLNDFVNVYKFFKNDLQIILPNQERLIKFNYFTRLKKNVKPLLCKLGLDISDLIEVDSDMFEIRDEMDSNNYNSLLEELNNLKSKYRKFNLTIRIGYSIYTIDCDGKNEKLKVKVIKVVHNNSNTYFDTYEESDGTLRILELLDILLSDNKVFVIDEINRSLHPSLTIEFISCFLEILKERNTQLIITTHESRLLDYNIIRRDEIWFTEKNNHGATKLYSLEQFKDDARFDRKIDKAYLDGRYGGVPIFERILEVNNENTDR